MGTAGRGALVTTNEEELLPKSRAVDFGHGTQRKREGIRIESKGCICNFMTQKWFLDPWGQSALLFCFRGCPQDLSDKPHAATS